MAGSKQVPGLMLAARSMGQIREELPGAVREVLEAQGKHVAEVTLVDQGMPADFVSSTVIAHATLAAAE